jgi:hypothetical protein
MNEKLGEKFDLFSQDIRDEIDKGGSKIKH